MEVDEDEEQVDEKEAERKGTSREKQYLGDGDLP